MPNAPKTPIRTFRAPDELWDAAKVAAANRGMTVTDVIILALQKLVQEELDNK
jgi:antitoxin component of RelBE/YafQ-DinJ toxin-antitoxin module